ncbi:MAG: hypothetical protein GF309_01715 [Candidatus Lokiarchaeota archaeon]|nr:hypothetical protein [Candidatus Lokiarchaeota archaeon]
MEKQLIYQPEPADAVPLTCLTVDHDGKRAACGTTEGPILLIDLEEGTVLKTLRGHEDIVSRVRFLKKGKYILSSSWDGTTRRWSLKKDKKESNILKHHTEVKSLAIADNESKGAAGGRDGEVKVFSVEHMKCIRNMQTDDLNVSGLHFADGDSQLLSVSWNGSCRIWDLKDYELLSTLREDKKRIRCLGTTPDDAYVLLGFHTGDIRVFPVEDPSTSFALEGHTDRITDFTLLPDNRMISSSWDRTIRLWSLDREKEVNQAKLWSAVSSVEWCPTCEQLFTTDFSGSLLAWTL